MGIAKRSRKVITRKHGLGAMPDMEFRSSGRMGGSAEEVRYDFSSSQMSHLLGGYERFRVLENTVGIVKTAQILRQLISEGVAKEELADHWGRIVKMAGIREKQGSSSPGSAVLPSDWLAPKTIANVKQVNPSAKTVAANQVGEKANESVRRPAGGAAPTIETILAVIKPAALSKLLYAFGKEKFNRLASLCDSPERNGAWAVYHHQELAIGLLRRGKTLEEIAQAIKREVQAKPGQQK